MQFLLLLPHQLYCRGTSLILRVSPWHTVHVLARQGAKAQGAEVPQSTKRPQLLRASCHAGRLPRLLICHCIPWPWWVQQAARPINRLVPVFIHFPVSAVACRSATEEPHPPCDRQHVQQSSLKSLHPAARICGATTKTTGSERCKHVCQDQHGHSWWPHSADVAQVCPTAPCFTQSLSWELWLKNRLLI